MSHIFFPKKGFSLKWTLGEKAHALLTKHQLAMDRATNLGLVRCKSNVNLSKGLDPFRGKRVGDLLEPLLRAHYKVLVTLLSVEEEEVVV